MFVYSARFSRRAVTRPGSGFIAASARANSVSRNFTRVLISASGRTTSSGGISCDLSLVRIDSQRSRSAASDSTDVKRLTSSPPARSVEL